MKKEKNYFQVLDEIYSIIEKRKSKNTINSYTRKLFKEGKNKISAKILEESNELIIDYLNGTKKRTIEEASDLIFHILVLLSSKKITPKDIAKELKSRYKK